MRRLNHPNIIQFVEVYEDADHLMMVMEYCPGKELFDVILARKYFREDDARPIFAQISRALFYLHSLHIIHRDVKPENVLILDSPDPQTGAVSAKLLDFGLSKNANGGSAAKTFVGTPCYLAPEVEYTSKGLGGTYGLPADCWSLGAVLYVMLVARFPEFEQDLNGKVVVKLPPVLWNNISSEAKDLIRGLMNTNPAARLTMADVLKHPWLGPYRATQDELTRLTVSTTDLSHHLQQEEEMIAAQEKIENVNLPHGGNEMTPMGTVVHHHAMILRQSETAATAPQFGPEQLKVTPLLHLQRSIATCFEEAHAQYHLMPEVATQVRRGAALCRQQMIESTKMLRKVEQTATEVLELFPDLELAIDEGEPKLATEFFNMVKGWVAELRELVNNTQKINKASMGQIQKVVEQSTQGLQQHTERSKSSNSINLSKKMMENIVDKLSDMGVVNSTMLHDMAQSVEGKGVTIDANQFVDLFVSLFQSEQAHGRSTRPLSGPNRTPPHEVYSPATPEHYHAPASHPAPPHQLYSATTAEESSHSMDYEQLQSYPTPPSPVQDLASLLQRPPVPSPAYSLSSHDADAKSNLAASNSLPSSTSQQSLVDSLAKASIQYTDSATNSPHASSGPKIVGRSYPTPIAPSASAAAMMDDDDRVEDVDMLNQSQDMIPSHAATGSPSALHSIAHNLEDDEGVYPDLPITGGGDAPSPRAANRLAEALQKLRQVQ